MGALTVIYIQKHRSFGWFHRPIAIPNPYGIHGIKREDLGDFWKYMHGQRHECRGEGGEGRVRYPVFCIMWVPNVKMKHVVLE